MKQSNPSIRELSQTIDPRNMSRNDARDIATALGRSGDLTIDNAFALQSMVLVRDNGVMRTATESDAIMNERFNMFDELNGQIEFNKSKGLSTESLEDALKFLEKFDALRGKPSIDFYA